MLRKDSFFKQMILSLCHKEDISAINHWLTYQDFKYLIQNESFVPVNLSAFECIGKVPDISVSERWFKLNNTYIPKNLIFDFAKVNREQTLQGFDTIRLYLLTGYENEVIRVKYHQTNSFMRRMSSVLGRKKAGSYHNEDVLRGNPYYKAFRENSKRCLPSRDAFINFINGPASGSEYISHPFIRENVRFVATCFIDKTIRLGSQYLWHNTLDGRVYSPKADCQIALVFGNHPDSYLDAVFTVGENENRLSVLKWHQVDFPFNENIQFACIEFVEQLRY